MAMQQRDLTKGSAVQILNVICIEYDFSIPKYTVKSLGIHQELPPFEAKVLETLSTKYIFLEEKLEKCLITESKFYNISDKNNKKLYKNGLIHVKGVFKEDI